MKKRKMSKELVERGKLKVRMERLKCKIFAVGAQI
jgi:hypothetical protein